MVGGLVGLAPHHYPEYITVIRANEKHEQSQGDAGPSFPHSSIRPTPSSCLLTLIVLVRVENVYGGGGENICRIIYIYVEEIGPLGPSRYFSLRCGGLRAGRGKGGGREFS